MSNTSVFIKATILFKTMRAPFLILTPVCIFLGLSVVIEHQVSINLTSLLLALSGAIFAHISVNMLNEYLDFKSGLDLLTERTPFSGGSGALPQNPYMYGAVLNVGILCLLLTLSIGGYFILRFGVGIVPIGLLGILLIISYTSWINKFPLLCLIAPGLGFALFVIGTQYVLVGEYLPNTWLIALVPFFLVSNLLLLNQYPDIEADKKAGRKHFPIVFGVNKSNVIYGLFIFLTAITIIFIAVFSYTPMLSLIALLPLPLALFSLSGAVKHGKSLGQYPQYLVVNVIVTLSVPLLLSISLIIGGS